MDTTKISNFLVKYWVDIFFVGTIFFTSCCFMDLGKTLFFFLSYQVKVLKVIIALVLPCCATLTYWAKRKSLISIGDICATIEIIFSILYVLDAVTFKLMWRIEPSISLLHIMYGLVTFFSVYATCCAITYFEYIKRNYCDVGFLTMSRVFFLGFTTIFAISFIMIYFVVRNYHQVDIDINLIPTQGEFRQVYDNGLSITVARDIGNVFFFTALAIMNLEFFKDKQKLWGLVVPVIVSIVMEFYQLITRCGDPDIDDVIANFFGALLGYFIYKLIIEKIKKPLIEASLV